MQLGGDNSYNLWIILIVSVDSSEVFTSTVVLSTPYKDSVLACQPFGETREEESILIVTVSL